MKQSANQKTKIIVYTLFILLLGVFLTYGFIYKFPTIFQETITKIEKDVTVTDTGIADAVDKVYDKVIIVSTYKNDDLYAFGSGFVYGKENDKFYIITNHHVIADGNKYKVTYEDGTEVDATLLGSDEYADIAVLSVDAKDDLGVVELGTTDSLRVGDTTFTVGAPLDYSYSWTVTRGIISGKERLVEVSLSSSTDNDYVMNVLQTDAAVNNGNSGGPLCNSNGEVIGVISAKISKTGVEGMGFAIPIELAKEKAEQIIKGEATSYPYLGSSMISVETAAVDRYFYNFVNRYKYTTGVILVDIEKGSAAEKAGLASGDVIIKINEKDINNVAYLRYELYKHKVGDTIKVTYLREGKEKSVSVKLESSLEKN